MRKGFFYFFVLTLTFSFILYGFQKKKQEQVSKPLEHEVTVILAVVEVFVTDKDGNFVDNLTKEDFEIYEDGKKVEIQYFAIVKPKEEMTEEIVPGKVRKKEIPPPAQKMKLVILFDNLNTNRVYLVNQWPQIVEMFQSLSGKVEETMIIELNRFSGMRIIQPFTTDQNLLTNKITEFKADSWKEWEEHYLQTQMEALAMEASVPLEYRFIGNPEYLMNTLRQEARYLKRMRLSDSFSAFLAAVNYIRRFEGVKSVLLVSDGFHLQERGTDIVKIFDPFKVFGKKRAFEQHEAFEKFLELINEERLIFYAISPRGLRQYFSAYGGTTWPGGLFSAERAQWKSDVFTLDEITHKTGGLHLKGEKKYEDFIKELGRDLTHFYDISYTPPKESRKKGFHRIEVRVKRPGLIVRHRKGYSDFTDE
ncbi:MAG: VWA domain-containing protein, partial [Candidatus Aminicenantales bacterium]